MELFTEYFSQFWGQLIVLVINTILSLIVLFEIIKSSINNNWDYKIPGIAIGCCFYLIIYVIILVIYLDQTKEISDQKYIELSNNGKCIRLLDKPIRNFHLEKQEYKNCLSNYNKEKADKIKKNL